MLKVCFKKNISKYYQMSKNDKIAVVKNSWFDNKTYLFLISLKVHQVSSCKTGLIIYIFLAMRS